MLDSTIREFSLLSLSSSPFGGTSSSSPAFTFASSSTPHFATSSTSFGGSTGFGQKPASGGFGSTPTQTNPFGIATQPSQPAFGSTIFGSSTPFGASSQPTFGLTKTPTFGATSTPTFGATSTPVFGATSNPAFGATSTLAFGSTGSAFGVSNTPFGGWGEFGSSNPIFGSTSTSAFGASSSPAFGFGSPHAFGRSNSAFGSSSPFGSTTSAFGAQSSAFGASSTPAFSFGSTHAFGQSSSAFGSTSPFGSTTSAFGGQSSAFGASSTTTFGFGSTHAFGQSSSAFGSSSPFGSTTSAFGDIFGSTTSAFVRRIQKNYRRNNSPKYREPVRANQFAVFHMLEELCDYGTTSAFGGQSSAFGASSTPAFSFGSTDAFGQSSYTFGSSSPFGSTTSAFGGQSSAFGSQTPTPALGNTGIGQSGFGGQRGGSRVASYSATIEADCIFGQTAKLESISAMHVYKNKSHEELRWEDYQLGDKGLQTPTLTFEITGIGQSGFGGQRGGSRVASYSATIEADCIFGHTTKLESISAMPVYKDKSHEELRWEDYQLGDKGTRLVFGPASENDRQQRNNSKGIIPQVNPAFLQVNDALLVRSPKREKNPAFWHNNVPTAPTAAEDLELAMAINESIQYALQKRPTFPDAQPNSGTSSSISGVNTGTQGSSCVMCLDAPAEGACVPCGHVAGCMSCLNVVKTKKRRCPICRAKIDQIIKLYHV